MKKLLEIGVGNHKAKSYPTTSESDTPSTVAKEKTIFICPRFHRTFFDAEYKMLS